MIKIGNIINSMTEYYRGDVQRINHFLKVYGFAKMIGELENLTKDQQDILEVSAIVHDIGIKVCEEKYGSSAGSYQETEGPPIAYAMLHELGYESNFIDRVCYLVAHHHTYNNITGMDYQILVEADFLVNIFENQMGKKQIKNIKEKIFKTDNGCKLLQKLYE